MREGMSTQNIELIVIGGSAGAVEALSAILPSLPADFALPVAMVLHLAPNMPSCLVDVLRLSCALTVKEAEDKEPLHAASLYVAPPNYHLLVEKQRCFSLSDDDLVHFSRPSIDVLFESAAEAYGPAALGLLLTGANEDGAHGMACIKEAGGTVLIQSPATALVGTMPGAALHLATPDHVLALPDIGSFLANVGKHAAPTQLQPTMEVP